MTMLARARVEALFDEMIRMQRRKVLQLAREVVPGVTADDILNPHDFPALAKDMQYQFEDGQLTGLLAAQMALRAEYALLRD